MQPTANAGRSSHLLNTRKLATAAISAAAGFGALAVGAPKAEALGAVVCSNVWKTFPANCAYPMLYKLNSAFASTHAWEHPCIHYHASNGGNYYACAYGQVRYPIAAYRKKSMQCYPHELSAYFYICQTWWPS
jgi:hypothetical protein